MANTSKYFSLFEGMKKIGKERQDPGSGGRRKKASTKFVQGDSATSIHCIFSIFACLSLIHFRY